MVEQLVELVDMIVEWAEGWYSSLPQELDSSDPQVLGALRAFHTMLLTCFLWGYMPPMRPGLVRSIQHPSCSRCSLRGCTWDGCKGNRLEVTELADGRNQWVLHAPHHKCVRFSKRPLRLVVAEELWPKLDIYCKQIWPLLRARGTTTLFMNQQGEPLTQGRLTQVWGEVQAQCRAPFYVPPNRLRHIFVEARLEDPDRPGPRHEDAALAMGNSVPTWVQHYHTTFASMAASRAVEEMAGFRADCRQRLLERRRQEAEQEQLPGEEGDDEQDLSQLMGRLDVVDEEEEWVDAGFEFGREAQG